MITKQNKTTAFAKKCNLFIFIALAMLTFSCEKDEESEEENVGNWFSAATFDGSPRSATAGFVINNKAYVGTGFDGDNYLKDFWEFDINGGFWVQKADFPGVERSFATGFSIENNGYIGTGYDGKDELKDFYKYDTATNTWTPIADFGNGKIRREAVGFNSNTHGYVGCGYDGVNDKKDFWKYDPVSDSWSEIFGFGGNKRRNSVTFKINDKVYLVTGKSNGVNLIDFWSFNLNNDSWTKLRDVDENEDEDGEDYTILRSNAVGFTIGNLGYIALGTPNTTTWEYHPDRDTWIEKTSFEATTRQDAFAISNGQRAFITLGRSGSLYLDDNLEFKPFDEQVDND
jgi:Galactose oxidase, central domain